MADVNPKLTRHVAELARLELSEEELNTFTTQLDQIVHYVDQLQEVDVSRVEPMTHPLEVPTPLREDKASSFSNENSKEYPTEYKVPPIL